MKRIFLVSFLLVVLILIGVILTINQGINEAGLSPDSKEIPSKVGTVSNVPGIRLGVDAYIRDIDFEVDKKESLHVAWLVNDTPHIVTAKGKIFYARGNNGGAVWSQPMELAQSGGSNLRILVASDDSSHLIFGRELRHFLSRDAGNSWKEIKSLIPIGERFALAFDAAIIDNSLIVVYLERREKDFGLYVVRWSDDKISSPDFIASFPKDDFSSLRLVADGKRLHFMYAMNTSTQIKEQGYTRFSSEARLFYLRSDDGGITWSSPVEASPGAARGATLSPSGIQHIEDVELLPTRKGLLAFYHEKHLYMTHTIDGLSWSPATRITEYQPSSLDPAFNSSSVSATVIGGQVRLAWIDSRHKETDRRWWKPLGGWPWSDQPDWANNDVFTTLLSDNAALSTQDNRVESHIKPQRLTPPLSYADKVRIRDSTNHYFIIWSGRRKVGKNKDMFGQPPELFYVSLPFSEKVER